MKLTRLKVNTHEIKISPKFKENIQNIPAKFKI
jgi:hypothetical protein